jgi:phosphogluconate dehydratase
MSGASGKVPSAIHLSPEGADGGPIAKLRDGDLVRVDATSGALECLEDGFEMREAIVPDLSGNQEGLGRELFAAFRDRCGLAADGAGTVV